MIALASAGFARRSQSAGGAEPFEGSAVNRSGNRRGRGALPACPVLFSPVPCQPRHSNRSSASPSAGGSCSRRRPSTAASASTWDYGPLGVELKNNVKRAWWKKVVHERDDMEGLDAAILMNRLVWKYSGHEATFSDPMTDCRACKSRPRADHVFKAQKGRDPKGLDEINAAIAAKELACPEVRRQGSDPGAPVQPDVPHHHGPGRHRRRQRAWPTCGPRRRRGSSSTSRTCSTPCGASCRSASPRSARRSATRSRPGNFTFRTREFEQMEIEYFVKPGEDEAAHQMWIDARTQWYLDLGMRQDNLRAARADQGRAGPLRQALRRPGVPLPHGLLASWRGSPTAPTSISRRTAAAPNNPDSVGRAALLRSGEQAAHRPLRDRAVGRRRPGDAGLPVRRLRGRAGQGRRRPRTAPSCASWSRASSSRSAKRDNLDADDQGPAGGRGRGDRRRTCPSRCRGCWP